MKRKILFILMMLCASLISVNAQGLIPPIPTPIPIPEIPEIPLFNPIDIGELKVNGPFEDTQTVMDFLCYRFKISEPLVVTISNCGSQTDETNIFLVNSSGTMVSYGGVITNLNYQCNSGLRYIQKCLPADTYDVICSGTMGSQVSISTSIEAEYPLSLLGGVYSSAFTFTDTKDIYDYEHNHNFGSRNYILHEFKITVPMDITLSHDGSQLKNTQMFLQNGSGRTIGFDESTFLGGDKRANISYPRLPAGTYYVISSAFDSTGSIKLSIKGSPSSPGNPGVPTPETNNNNYVKTITPTIATSSTSDLTVDNSIITYQYFDGLGRAQQTVQQGASAAKTDLVAYQEYDSYGRESNTWLPVAAAAGNNGKPLPLATVQSLSSSLYGDSKAYGKPVYEPSPLNRISEQYGPGNDWHTNSKRVKTEYLSNNTTYVCRLYRTTDTRNSVQISITSGKVNYTAGELYVTRITDEDGNISYEFTDKLGQVVLTRQMNGTTAHDTYYVYDSYGNLRAVLPPLAADALTAASTNWTDATTAMARYAYLYKYDERNRCIAKKLPGADWIYYVYDHADRMIFSQDGEARAQNKWIFSIPDALGRTVLTGTCTNTMTYTAKPLGSNVVKATRNNTTGTYKGYTVAGVILNGPVVLSVNYYDDYDFMGKNSIPASTHADYKYEAVSGYGTRYTASSKGLLTGTMSAQVNQSGITTSFLYSVMYYDNRGRMIQAKSNNHLAGGIEKEYIGYNFSGQPIKRKLVHQATGKTTQTQLYEYTYDHAGRPLQTKHGLNTATATNVIALNAYDDLGRLKSQKKGSLPVTTYGYNVRSWTKSITNSTLFNQTLYYNDSYASSTKRYNGNISAMSWKIGSETLKGYKFAYDGLSRLTAAEYLVNSAANTNNTVSGITYDKHGNMRTIQRRGKTTATAYGVIDNLTMTYTGNQLTNVTDAGTTVSIAESNDFKKKSATNPGYAYNKNGAMTKDLNKGISSISYNLLSLPSSLTIGGVVNNYVYSADGSKLKVVQGSTNRDYVGSVIYENRSLKRILIDGGYIEGGTYYYFLNDHLGNTRVVASGTGTIAQRNQYYPFGMPFAETTNAEQDKQPYKYNGKEFDRTNGLNLYDYHARQMDPAIGRFTMMDPLAEKYYSVSPYAYCNNNPIIYVDPDGESPAKIIKAVYNVGKRVYKTYKATGKANIGTALKSEALNIVDNVSTLFDSDASTLDKVFAGVDLLTGFGSEAKAVTKTLGVIDDVSDAGKQAKKINPKKAAREKGKAKRDAQPASEDYVNYKAKEKEKVEGKDSRRKSHDAKDKGEPDRSKKRIDEDYEINSD